MEKQRKQGEIPLEIDMENHTQHTSGKGLRFHYQTYKHIIFSGKMDIKPIEQSQKRQKD